MQEWFQNSPMVNGGLMLGPILQQYKGSDTAEKEAKVCTYLHSWINKYLCKNVYISAFLGKQVALFRKNSFMLASVEIIFVFLCCKNQ